MGEEMQKQIAFFREITEFEGSGDTGGSPAVQGGFSAATFAAGNAAGCALLARTASQPRS